MLLMRVVGKDYDYVNNDVWWLLGSHQRIKLLETRDLHAFRIRPIFNVKLYKGEGFDEGSLKEC